VRRDRLGGLIHEYAQVACGDRISGTHKVLRPAELQDPGLVWDLQREGLLGDLAALDPRQGTTPEVRGETLHLTQRDATVRLDTLGTVAVELPAAPASRDWPASLPAVVVTSNQPHARYWVRWLGDSQASSSASARSLA
jgi:hypothetical protein